MTPSVRQPCKSCPWRLDSDIADIPGFHLDLAEKLERTCDGQLGSPMMACHQSSDDKEFVCAGWLATYGYHSLSVRLTLSGVDITGLNPNAVMKGITIAGCEPGDDWPEMHGTFEEFIQKLRDQTAELEETEANE